jgi:hypothetical protein
MACQSLVGIDGRSGSFGTQMYNMSTTTIALHRSLWTYRPCTACIQSSGVQRTREDSQVDLRFLPSFQNARTAGKFQISTCAFLERGEFRGLGKIIWLFFKG